MRRWEQGRMLAFDTPITSATLLGRPQKN